MSASVTRGMIIELSSLGHWGNWIILLEQSEGSVTPGFCSYYESLYVLFTPHKVTRVITLRGSPHIIIPSIKHFPWLPTCLLNKTRAPFNSILISSSSDTSLRAAPDGLTSVHPLSLPAQFPSPKLILSFSISRLCSKHGIYLKNPFHTLPLKFLKLFHETSPNSIGGNFSLFMCLDRTFSSYDTLYYSYLGTYLHT